jgi:hypothetical protein
MEAAIERGCEEAPARSSLRLDLKQSRRPILIMSASFRGPIHSP